MFQSSKGAPVEFGCTSRRVNRGISDLTDYYGLDIRRVGYRRCMLCGEWFGKVYIDYVAERMEKK